MIRLLGQRTASTLVLLLGVFAGGAAQADTTYEYTYDYRFNVNGCTGTWYSSCNLTGNQTGNSVTPTPAPTDPNAPAATLSATATGWANTQGNSSAYSTQTLEQGHLQAWSGGLGVRNLDYSSTANGGESRVDLNEGSSPEHAVDNQERYDSILYSFGESFTLTGISLSWYSNDSDLSVLAYTGDTVVAGFNINNSLLNLRYDGLTSNGWSFISHLTTGGNNKTLSTEVSSSYWLIGAANPLVGGSGLDSNLDHVKIAALSGKITTEFTKHDTPPPGVPEPGSLALLGLGGLLLLRARSKR